MKHSSGLIKPYGCILYSRISYRLKMYIVSSLTPSNPTAYFRYYSLWSCLKMSSMRK